MEYKAKKCASSKRKADHSADSMQTNINYCDEISSIMHALGDVESPEPRSVKLMHNILQSQMALLITNAESILKLRSGRRKRKGKKISHEDILFQMRKNKVLLKRLLQFLHIEDIGPSLKKIGSCSKHPVLPEEGEKVSQCLKYLALIEKFTGDLTSILRNKNIVDYGYIKQLKRRDLMGMSMTEEQYLKFNQHKRASLCQNHTTEKFKKWLQQISSTEFDITPLALSIIHFLARETIARIIEKALEIKSRKFGNSDNNPYKNFIHSVDLWYELDSFDLTKSENNSVNMENCPTTTDVREGHNIADNSPDAVQEMSTASNSSYSKSCYRCKPNLSNASVSEHKISNFLDTYRNLYSNAENSETDYDIWDDENKSDENKYHMINEDKSSTVICETRASKTSSDTLLFNASKETSDILSISLNIEEKTCDDLKTFETELKENNDQTMSCIAEFVEEPTKSQNDFALESPSHDFDELSKRFLLNTPMKINSKIHWFPDDAITPVEIQAAFIHYQHPLFKPYLIKTDRLSLMPRKTNLVCLAELDEQDI